MSYLVDLGNDSISNNMIKKLLEGRKFTNKSKNWRDINQNLLTGDWSIAIKSSDYFRVDKKIYYLWDIPKIKFRGKEIIRIINHYPNPSCITNKANLTRNLIKNVPSWSEFYKESHIINLSKYKLSLDDYMENLLKFIDENLKEGVWITKPSDLYKGKNIKVHKDKETLKRYFKNISTELGENDEEYIIQKYIENPMLYDRRKFDIRVHVLLDKDFNIYIHEFSLMRLSSFPYTKDYENQATQITNYDIQKGVKTDLEKVLPFNETYIKKDLLIGLKGQFCYIINQILPPLKEKLLEGKNDNFQNYYELFGFDFIIEENEENAKVFLLEINLNPGLSGDISGKFNLGFEKMLDNTFSIVIDPIFKTNKLYEDNEWVKIYDGKINRKLV